MRLSLSFFILLLASFASLASPSCGHVSISAHPNYPPFHWKEGDTLTGASIAVAVEILESMDIKPIVSYQGPWKRVLKKAERGEIDLIPALKDTEERRTYLTFTTSPFYFNPVAVFVKQDFPKQINSLTDLDGLRGSIALGDKHGKPIDDFIKSQDSMQSVERMSSNFKMLKLGRTDYFIQGLYAGNEYLNVSPLRDEIRLAKTFDANWVHNGFSKAFNCPEVLERFDKRLKNMLESGYVEQKMNEYEEKWLRSKL